MNSIAHRIEQKKGWWRWWPNKHQQHKSSFFFFFFILSLFLDWRARQPFQILPLFSPSLPFLPQPPNLFFYFLFKKCCKKCMNKSTDGHCFLLLFSTKKICVKNIQNHFFVEPKVEVQIWITNGFFVFQMS